MGKSAGGRAGEPEEDRQGPCPGRHTLCGCPLEPPQSQCLRMCLACSQGTETATAVGQSGPPGAWVPWEGGVCGCGGTERPPGAWVPWEGGV